MKVQKGPPQSEPEKLPLDELAHHIRILSNIGLQLRNSKLKEKAILVLLRDMTGLSYRDIKTVLQALPMLEKEFLK